MHCFKYALKAFNYFLFFLPFLNDQVDDRFRHKDTEMGKVQSKRSMDITTEQSKDAVQEGSGKVGKIEEVDQPIKLNGDTNHETVVSVKFLIRLHYSVPFNSVKMKDIIRSLKKI